MNPTITQAHTHPRLMSALGRTAFFNITCAIEQRNPEDTRTATGGLKQESNWVPVDGMEAIPARREVNQSNEPRYLWGQAERRDFKIFLNGFHPEIEPGNMRANLSTGDIIDITAVDSDSELRHTQLLGRIYVPTVESGL